jgi:hypothetical protein
VQLLEEVLCVSPIFFLLSSSFHQIVMVSEAGPRCEGRRSRTIYAISQNRIEFPISVTCPACPGVAVGRSCGHDHGDVGVNGIPADPNETPRRFAHLCDLVVGCSFPSEISTIPVFRNSFTSKSTLNGC